MYKRQGFHYFISFTKVLANRLYDKLKQNFNQMLQFYISFIGRGALVLPTVGFSPIEKGGGASSAGGGGCPP